MRLQGKVAIVTGAGRGIGRAIARAMAEQGASVVVNDVDADVAEETALQIAADGGAAIACVARIGTKEAADAVVAAALSKLGGLHILVNNAGITRDALLLRMTEEQWDEVMTVHLKGTFLTTQAAVRVMARQKYGKIVNITSVAGTRGNVGQSNYAAAKAGIIGLTMTWAKELVRHQINVNCISPLALTRIYDNVPEKVRDAMFEQMASASVLQRVAFPEDVAPLAVFLASDDAAYLSGQIIGATGAAMSLL